MFVRSASPFRGGFKPALTAAAAAVGASDGAPTDDSAPAPRPLTRSRMRRCVPSSSCPRASGAACRARCTPRTHRTKARVLFLHLHTHARERCRNNEAMRFATRRARQILAQAHSECSTCALARTHTRKHRRTQRMRTRTGAHTAHTKRAHTPAPHGGCAAWGWSARVMIAARPPLASP